MGQRILVTGHNGYLGSVMVPWLAAAGHEITGLDTGYFSKCTLVADHSSAIRSIQKDLRELTPHDLEGYETVVHLAALSNDPIGNLNDSWTESINLIGSVRLAEAAKAAGVSRFLFSSSCIMYGAAEQGVVNEESPLDPKTIYARSKALAESAISTLASSTFSPVFLRNGTVYGLSPRMRFDTVNNSLIGSAVVHARVTIHSDGKPWRPVVHIEDVAEVFRIALEAPRERVHNQAFNAGSDAANHQIRELAEMVAEVSGCRIECLSRPDADQRTYVTSFAKIGEVLPEFRPRWALRDGVKDLYDRLRRIGLAEATYSSRKFTRLAWLNHLLETGQLDSTLSWARVEALV
jgi:nucleoside-diphosphate-sugar epimerase